MRCPRKLVFSALLVILTVIGASGAWAWQLKQAPVMTDWATQVNPANPLPEYPRPQMVRSDWMNLNGVWQFKRGYANDAVPVNQTLSGDILVPYPVESAISGVMAHYDRVWYRRTFEVPAAWAGKRIMLNFGAVDWESQVYINGTSVGIHKGGFDAFSYDITPYLKPNGPQEIIVRVFDPTDAGGQARGKQVNNPGGIFYTASTGIWQTVWLEPVATARISSLKIVPDVDNNRLRLTVNTTGATAGMTVTATAKDGGTAVGTVTGNPDTQLYISIPTPKLWSPTSPFLYDLDVSLNSGGAAVDSVTSYFGMRKIAMAMVGGINKLVLNGQFVFQIGPLDQGFWPDGLFTAPTDAALKWDIETEKQLGFNTVRKHVKIEPARWYYWADKLGLLVWQDMPGAGNGSAADKTQFEVELQRMVETHWNSPSIIMWIVFNEGWGQYDTERLTNWVMNMDPSRVVSCASGWTDYEIGHVLDYHSYPHPASPTSSTRARVCGEYGGIGYAIQGHMWNPNSWGYTTVTSAGDLTDLYAQYTSTEVGAFKNNNGLSAAIYTQITDVETEINGLVTYDRKVIKPIISAIYDANHFSYVPVTYTITASAGTGGTISPSGNVVVKQRTNKTFTIATNPTGYAISDVKVDGVSQGAISTYTFNDITANHTISALFVAIPTYTITATAGTGGNISPSGSVIVNKNASKTFTITPGVGYAISDVKVDNVSKGAITTFTFDNVTAAHTISASFVAMPNRTITASAGANGTISPSGAVSVAYGANQTFTFPANTGYQVADVKVDGVSKGAVTSYEFTNVISDHTIDVTFTVLTPIAYYQFENNVLDTHGAYNGTAHASPTYVTGKSGLKAIQFNGVDQYVSINRPVSGDFSIAFFVKTTQTSLTGGQWYNGSGIVDGEVGGVTDDFGISYLNSKVAFGIGNVDKTFQSTSTINSGNWVHVACTRNSTTGQMKIYINGVLETTGTGPIGTKASPNALHIGSLQSGINFFNGAIDQLKIFSSVITPTDVAALAAEGGIYSITASAETGGTINPNGIVTISPGSDQLFTITPSAGYAIADVKVDNVSVGTVTSYTFTNVTANHTISATFNALPVIVTGRVTDVTSGAAIAGASVYFSTSANPSANPAYTATTDASGNYSQVLPTGTWYGAAKKAGYDMSADKTITVTAGSAPTLNFALSLTPIVGTEVLYKFDETSGTAAADSSGSGKNGTLTNGPVWTAGRSANCLSFDGTDDYVAVPDLGDYAAITISAWINLDSLGTTLTSPLIACNGSDAEDIQLQVLKGSGNIRFTLTGNTAANVDSNYAFTTADFGKWRHVAVVYDSTAKTVKFYINGGLNATRTLTTTRTAALAGGVRLGGWSGGRYLDGKIDEFHIYGRALSASEIAAIVNSAPSVKIADAKKLANGEMVTLKDKVVTYAPRNASNIRCTPYFFIEEPDKSAGIRVQTPSALQDNFNIDTKVTVSGTMKTNMYTNERYMELSTSPEAGTAGVVNALGMTTRSIATDPSAQGLLVRVAGKVTQISPEKVWFTIQDGYGVNIAAICETEIPLSGFEVGDTVAVTGPVTGETISSWNPEPIVYIRSVVKL